MALPASPVPRGLPLIATPSSSLPADCPRRLRHLREGPLLWSSALSPPAAPAGPPFNCTPQPCGEVAWCVSVSARMEIPEMRTLGWADADAHASGDGVGYEESRPPLLGCLSFSRGLGHHGVGGPPGANIIGTQKPPHEVPSCALPLWHPPLLFAPHTASVSGITPLRDSRTWPQTRLCSRGSAVLCCSLAWLQHRETHGVFCNTR